MAFDVFNNWVPPVLDMLAGEIPPIVSDGLVAGGVATLAGGTSIVSTTFAHTDYPIILGYYSLDGNVTAVGYSTIVDGVSFKIISADNTDTNKVSWQISAPQ